VWVLAQDCGREREEALLAGADDCVARTASPRETALQLARAIRGKKTLEKLEDSTAMVLTLANAVEGKDAYTCGIALGPPEHISVSSIPAWTEPRMKELDRLVADIESAINVRLPPAVGEPGEPGDLREIVAVARFVGARYRETIEWSLRIRCAVGPRGFEAVVDAFAHFPDDVLAKVESAGRPLLRRAKDGITRALAGESVTIDTRLDFQLSHRLEFAAALKRLK